MAPRQVAEPLAIAPGQATLSALGTRNMAMVGQLDKDMKGSILQEGLRNLSKNKSQGKLFNKLDMLIKDRGEI